MAEDPVSPQARLQASATMMDDADGGFDEIIELTQGTDAEDEAAAIDKALDAAVDEFHDAEEKVELAKTPAEASAAASKAEAAAEKFVQLAERLDELKVDALTETRELAGIRADLNDPEWASDPEGNEG